MSEHEQVSGNNQQEPNSAAEEWNELDESADERRKAEMDALHQELEKTQNRTEAEYYDDFSGETNKMKNGKDRSYVEWDLYPRNKGKEIIKGEKGETKSQFGRRLREKHSIEKKFESGSLSPTNSMGYLNDEYIHSNHGRLEREAEADFSNTINRIEQGVADGKYSREVADRLLAKRREMYDRNIADIRQDYINLQRFGDDDSQSPAVEETTIEDTSRPPEATESKGDQPSEENAKTQQQDEQEKTEAEAKERADDEQKERDEDEQKERDDDEQKERNEDEQKEKDKAESEEKAKVEQENKSDKEKELAEIEKEIAAVDKLYEEKLSRKNTGNREVIENLKKQIKTSRAELGKAEHDLAESYAKNRGLFGGKNRAAFHEKQERYKEQLNECLRLEAELNYKLSQQKDGELINFEKNKLIERIKAGDLTSEKAGQLLAEKWSEIDKTTKSEISVKFVDSYINEQKSLAAATCKQIDEGNNYRKFVSKILNSKKLRTILAVAGAAGLAATGIGLATGALAFTIGYSAGGIALGAGKGALSGAIMSRQDSRNSAVRSFVDSDKIKADLSSINYEAIENGQDIANVTNWLMKQYDAANQADRHSNRKRTAIAMGLGAAIGVAMSGVHINQVTTETREGYTTSHYEPTEIKAANLEDVNHAKGYGTQQLYRELGGDGESYFSSGAHEQMAEIIKKYGMTVGKNDWTYPGPLNEWPEVAREAFSEVANEWAKQGLVPATKIGGQPVYDAVTYTVDKLIESKLYNFFTQAGAIVEAGVLGGMISGIRNRVAKTESMPEVKPAPEVTSALPVQPIQETAPEATTQEAAKPDQAPTQEGEAAPESNYDTTTRNTFQNRVNDQLLEFMTSDADYNGLDSNTMRFRLMELPVDVRNEVINYMDTHSDERHGRALRDEINVMRSEGQL